MATLFLVAMATLVLKGLTHIVTNGGASLTKVGITVTLVHLMRVVHKGITICPLITLVIFGVEPNKS